MGLLQLGKPSPWVMYFFLGMVVPVVVYLLMVGDNTYHVHIDGSSQSNV
jgi:ribonucleotide monophosphatase NagD (HAD superfamily)